MMASLLLLVSLLVLSLCAVDSLRGSCRAAVFVSKSANVYANVYAPLAKSGFASGRSALRMSAGGEQEGIVTMYKKEGCPYCKKAIELLSGTYKLDIKFVDIESTEREEILSQMRTFSGGRNTVPQIFFNSEHLGGNDDVQRLEAEGKLKEKVEMVRKTPVSMMMDHWYHPHY